MGAEQTSRLRAPTSENDPKRTSASISCFVSKPGFCPFPMVYLSRYDVVLSLGFGHAAPRFHHAGAGPL